MRASAQARLGIAHQARGVAKGVAAVAGDIAHGIHVIGDAASLVVGLVAVVAGRVLAGDRIAQGVVGRSGGEGLEGVFTGGRHAGTSADSIAVGSQGVHVQVVDPDWRECGLDLAVKAVVLIGGGAFLNAARGLGAGNEVATGVIAAQGDDAGKARGLHGRGNVCSGIGHCVDQIDLRRNLLHLMARSVVGVAPDVVQFVVELGFAANAVVAVALRPAVPVAAGHQFASGVVAERIGLVGRAGEGAGCQGQVNFRAERAVKMRGGAQLVKLEKRGAVSVGGQGDVANAAFIGPTALRQDEVFVPHVGGVDVVGGAGFAEAVKGGGGAGRRGVEVAHVAFINPAGLQQDASFSGAGGVDVVLVGAVAQAVERGVAACGSGGHMAGNAFIGPIVAKLCRCVGGGADEPAQAVVAELFEVQQGVAGEAHVACGVVIVAGGAVFAGGGGDEAADRVAVQAVLLGQGGIQLGQDGVRQRQLGLPGERDVANAVVLHFGDCGFGVNHESLAVGSVKQVTRDAVLGGCPDGRSSGRRHGHQLAARCAGQIACPQPIGKLGLLDQVAIAVVGHLGDSA